MLTLYFTHNLHGIKYELIKNDYLFWNSNFLDFMSNVLMSRNLFAENQIFQ